MNKRGIKAAARVGAQASGSRPEKQARQAYFYASDLFWNLSTFEPQTQEELIAQERATRAFFHLMRHTLFAGLNSVNLETLSADSGMPAAYLQELFPCGGDPD